MLTEDEKEWRPTFLVVDDDPIVRKLVSHGLKSLDPAEILEVEDGREAQQVLAEREVDVVVTDVLMPHMNGLELMKWAQEHHPGPLWIVLSSLDTFDAAVDALHLGAFDFLAKPPQAQRVQVAVRHALDQLALIRDRKRLYLELESSHDKLAEKVQQLEGLCRMLEDQAHVIRGDLARAEVIQRALLPQIPPKLGDWCVEALYRPGSNVGGDYYDVVPLGPDHLGLVIADAAGHGVAAAMLSVLFKHRLDLLDDGGLPLEPREVLAAVNNEIHGDMAAPGMFITAAYVLLDRRTGHLRIASAGHPPIVCASRNGASRLVSRTGPALGLRADAEYGQEGLDLAKGDRLLLYTDGVVEGGSSSPSTTELSHVLSSSEDERSKILRDFYEAATVDAGEDRDDVTMVLLERNAGESRFDAQSEPRDKTKPAVATSTPAQILQCVAEQRGFISIAGSANWMRSSAFFGAASKLLKLRKSLVIDLADCDYLDSTFLGTLHEIVISSPDVARLQRVTPKIRALFEELDMHGVLSRISADPIPLPARMQPLRRRDEGFAEQGQRVLRAHEILASLSDENQEQFRSVVESLRKDLQGGEHA